MKPPQLGHAPRQLGWSTPFRASRRSGAPPGRRCEPLTGARQRKRQEFHALAPLRSADLLRARHEWALYRKGRGAAGTCVGDTRCFSLVCQDVARNELGRVVPQGRQGSRRPWIEPADIEGERRRLSAGSFARLWENRWVQAEDHLVAAENLARCGKLTTWPSRPVRGRWYVIGVDIGVKYDNTAVVVAHTETRDGERRVALDDVAVFKPSRGAQVPLRKVEDRVEMLARRYNNAAVYFDPSQAYSMIESLRGRGIRVEENPISAPVNDRMATLLHTMLRDGLVDLPTRSSTNC
jgi:hypothetical protein